MDAAVVAAISAAVGSLLTIAGTQIVNLRKAPAEARLIDAQAVRAQREAAIADAQADKAQAEANRLLLENLQGEIARLKARIDELEHRLSTSEARSTSAEARLAESEARGNEFRRAVIAVGERLDRERREFGATIEKLCVIVEHLLECVEHPERAGEVDGQAIQRVIGTIRARPAEGGV